MIELTESLLMNMIDTATNEGRTPTDFVFRKKEFRTFLKNIERVNPELFKDLSKNVDFRVRKKSLMTFCGINVWVNEKVPENHIYLFDRNTYCLKNPFTGELENFTIPTNSKICNIS